MARLGRKLSICLMAALVISGVAFSVNTASGHSSVAGAATSQPAVQANVGLTPSQCTSDGARGCKATLPCSSAPCPTVDVSPNGDLQNEQSVTIKTTDFSSQDSFRVALCSGVTSSTDPSCLTGLWDNSDYTPISIPVSDNQAQGNLTTVTYPVFLEPSGEGNTVLPALDVLDHNNNTPGFFCDNSKDPCDIVVTDEVGQGPVVGLGPTVDATNSIIVPLKFRAQTSGCPASAPQISTYGSTSIEQLLPTVTDATCSGSTGVVPFNITLDTQSVVSGYASGTATVGFIDNPQDAAQLSALKGKHYEFVPVAISASTVAFLAGDVLNSLSVPISTYNLTPNMVAGLITSEYESPTGNPKNSTGGFDFADSDNLVSALEAGSPSVTCAQIYGCIPNNRFSESNLDSFDLFNSLSPDAVVNGGVSPQSFGSFMPNVPTGASYQTTDWLCHAPNPTTTATVLENVPGSNPVATPVRVNDPNAAPATLTFAPQSSVWPPSGDTGAAWVFPVCKGISDFPSISGSSIFFSAASTPALQAKNMRSWAYGGSELPLPQNQDDPLAAFGIMDSSQAQFAGLNEASLENASGNFVAPTPASVEAGLAAAQLCTGSTITSTCPANTYQYSYSNPDPTAYPMPDITYAIVPTSPQPAATATNIKNLLTNMINFSTSGALPSGYYPMPASMAKSALAELSSIVAKKTPPTTTTTTTTTTTSPTTTTPTTTTPTSTSPVVSGESNSAPGTTLSLTPTSTPTAVVDTKVPGSTGVKRSTTPAAQQQKTQAPAPHAHQPIPIDLSLIGLNSASRLLLPFALLLALLCLAGGLLILQRVRVAAKYGGASKKP
jgi:hypothetical protein